jgi:hypothetical protein
MPTLDPAEMTPVERARDVAALFARALRRLHNPSTAPPLQSVSSVPQKLPESILNGLAVPPNPSVTVHAG